MTAQKSALSRYLFKAVLGLTLAGLAFVILTVVITAGKSRDHAFTYRVAGNKPPSADALNQTVEVLRRRTEALSGSLGVVDLHVDARPPRQVEIGFTTRWNPDKAQTDHAVKAALAWLTMPGRVEFRLLHPRDGARDGAPENAAEEPPSGYEIKLYRARQYKLSHPGDLETVEHRYLVRAEPALAIDAFRSVEIETPGLHKKAVLTFDFEPDDARKFGRLTALHVGRRMAMLVDGEMFTPPREIEQPLSGGKVQVHGYFYLPPLRRLVAVLNAGPLPRPLERVDQTVE